MSATAEAPDPLALDTRTCEERSLRLRRRLERLIGIAATEGNSLLPLRNGDEIFGAMLDAIRGAEHTIDLMTFVYWRGDIAHKFAEALADRARAGVRVRLMLDGFGSRLIEKDQLALMDEAGVTVTWFRKPLYLSPHILSRFYTVPTARAARRSVVWSIGLIGGFYLMTIVLGFGAAALVGSAEVRASNAAGNTAVPLLALRLGGGEGSTGGTILFALVAAIAFATILAVVAGITLASSASVAHDLYATLRRPGRRKRGEVAVARIAAAGTGAVAIGLGLLAQDLNVAFLVGLAFAVAASANLPALLYSLFWRGFTTRGAVWAVYGG